MTVSSLLAALGFVLAAEGLFYAAFPGAVRRVLAQLLERPEEDFRRLGLAAAALGALLVAAGALLMRD